ncbi:MAG TPA: hypothetical protein VD838_23125 [Anaeromyxobacteraceae bacterium]|nr:hypothetical protein [Anaeromyxobacteraceae bacterium]
MFPNVVAPAREWGRWELRTDEANPAHSDLQGQTIAVPTKMGLLDQAGRLHELAHVNLTGRDEPAGIARAAVEDARIQEQLQSIYRPGWEVVELVHEATLRLMSERNADENPLRAERYKQLVRAVAAHPSPGALGHIRALGYGAQTVRTIGKCLATIGSPKSQEELAKLLESLAPAEYQRPSELPMPPAMEQAQIRPDPRRMIGRGLTQDSAWAQPGALTIKKPELTLRTRSKESRFRRGEFGSIHRVDRLLTDGAAFREKRPNRLGTVLIDVSGSMGPGRRSLGELVNASASHTVAIYACDEDSERKGQLIVVAQKGWAHPDPWALREDNLGGANVVDIPALEWLCRQERPRFWVSDGDVTGVNDIGSSEIRELAGVICRAGGVKRLDSLEQATGFFRTGALRQAVAAD